MAQSEYRGNG